MQDRQFIAMAFGHLIMIFMAVLIFNTASMCNAENAVSVQTGSSIQLDIQTDKLPQFQTLVWMNEKSKSIVTFINKEPQIFKDNVVFNQTTFSLTLKNMQKTDSGLYTAKIFGPNEEVAKYRVSVIDPVDSPVLNWNVTMISVNSCIVNVTCSSPDRTISNSYHSNCSQEEVTSTGLQPLTVYCKEDIVICNYSNTVSWRNDTIQIKQLCTTYENKSPEEINSSFPFMATVTSASLMILVATLVLYCSCKNHNKGAQQDDHTVYTQVQYNAVICMDFTQHHK
ncbi:natural killer cell receptor 2B4-like isoform X2 [Megalobrama amblycephala]|uniref:natural killer cell receptor 2B4-like isoform X2 n=1 Tax=Megalobrama amblycephala TaxID=75352 RepID=UPI002013E945|nr:natural killer cell receptor 2B4-like isoform X2 [Megalobrama amblycephala]